MRKRMEMVMMTMKMMMMMMIMKASNFHHNPNNPSGKQLWQRLTKALLKVSFDEGVLEEHEYN